MSDLIQQIVLPMVEQRSREPGDAWDMAATELRLLRGIPSAAELARVIDPLAFDPPNHWTLGNIKAAKKRAADKAAEILAYLRAAS